MKELINLLPLLKIGASKEPYPVYAQCLNSTGSQVQTCNNNVYVSLDCRLPFKGTANFFTLNGILEKLAERDFSSNVKEDKILVKTNNSQYSVSLLNLDFPQKEAPEIDSVDLDEDLLQQLRIASKFTGKEIYSYVYLFSDGILATNTTRMFYKQIKIPNIKKPVAINTKILSTLFDGCAVGSDENNNTVVFYPNGFAVFTVDNISYYPAEKILKFMETNEERQVLCNILALREWFDSITPIFGMDKANYISVKKEGKKLVLSAESAASGEAVMVQEVECTNDFRFLMDAGMLKDCPSSFDVKVGTGNLDRLVLSDGDGGVVVLMGARVN